MMRFRLRTLLALTVMIPPLIAIFGLAAIGQFERASQVAGIAYGLFVAYVVALVIVERLKTING